MMKTRKPTEIRPSTPSTRALNTCGRLAENSATARVHRARISSHSSSEPSCAPHTAEKRYSTGSRELLLRATYSTEKSCTRKAQVSSAKLPATRAACTAAARGATAISRALPLRAPASGRMPRQTATSRAPSRAI